MDLLGLLDSSSVLCLNRCRILSRTCRFYPVTVAILRHINRLMNVGLHWLLSCLSYKSVDIDSYCHYRNAHFLLPSLWTSAGFTP